MPKRLNILLVEDSTVFVMGLKLALEATKLVFENLRKKVIDYKPELFPELNIRNFAIKTYSNAIGDSPFNPDLLEESNNNDIEF